MVGVVDRLGVGAEEIGEGSGVGGVVFVFMESYQEVKVVFHQTVGVGICDGVDVANVKVEEVLIVTFLNEEIFAVVAPIVDVVVVSADEGRFF